jgi:hypothetical protein
MGGFIAQTLAGLYAVRVRSLTLIMTSTGARLVGYPQPQLIRHLLKRRKVTDREGGGAFAGELFARDTGRLCHDSSWTDGLNRPDTRHGA